ncbi:hypothetical protein J0A67_11455 [Algoriphagus aestuariicola]|uniref:Energy transducer TonB n=1 Tax=Algoriphagus aestuariicola TaxID=1852016 RepID=A0ABS3BRG5_9BACT|nr:hypothetical protein [Algoriphagus aestuariicola]MBN7801481.1 hypothetical protein [Algoriphagus aestuariicola]
MRWILTVIFTFLLGQSFAQEASETLIRLNRHYFEITPEDTINHVYNKLVSPLGNSARVERIFTLDQRLSRVVLTKHTRYQDLDRVTEQFDEYGHLQWRRVESLVIPKISIQYFFDDQVVGKVLSGNRYIFHITRNGENGAAPKPYNDFEPQFNGLRKEWYEFVAKNFRLSMKLYPEKPEDYWIAVLVSEHGLVEKIEWANPLEGNPKIAAEYVRVVKLWDNNFSPALDPYGHPVPKWLLIPFTVEAKVRYPIHVFDPEFIYH